MGCLKGLYESYLGLEVPIFTRSLATQKLHLKPLNLFSQDCRYMFIPEKVLKMTLNMKNSAT